MEQIEHFLKLLSSYNKEETFVYDKISQKYYIHFIKDGKAFIKCIETGERSVGDSGELIFIKDSGLPKSYQKATETAQKDYKKTTKKLPKTHKKATENYRLIPGVEITKSNNQMVVVINETFDLHKDVIKQSSAIQDETNRIILKEIETIADRKHKLLRENNSWDKEKYNQYNLIVKHYLPAVNYAKDNDIVKLKEKLKWFQNSETIQIETFTKIKEKKDFVIKKEKTKKKLILAIVFILFLSLIFIAIGNFHKNKNEKVIYKEVVSIEYFSKDTLKYLIKDFETNNKFKFTEYRTNLIYSSLPDSFLIETAKEKINYYYLDLKK